MKFVSVLVAAIALVLASPVLHATGAPGAGQPPKGEAQVDTRAIVRSISKEDGRLLIRLKLLPRARLPFSTITYRVLDGRLVEGLRQGDSVAFRAERRDGDNVLTAIRSAPPCQRFEECR